VPFDKSLPTSLFQREEELLSPFGKEPVLSCEHFDFAQYRLVEQPKEGKKNSKSEARNKFELPKHQCSKRFKFRILNFGIVSCFGFGSGYAGLGLKRIYFCDII